MMNMKRSVKRVLKRFGKDCNAGAVDHLQARAKLREVIQQRILPSNELAVEVWGRDCDNCEAAYVEFVKPMVPALVQLENRVFRDAEGPTSVTILTPNEFKHWHSYFIDHNAINAGY